MSSSLHAVILAGGRGTRFWPASRKRRPKQFLSVVGGPPLLARTRARLEGWVAPENTWVVTGSDQADLVRACLPDLPAENLLAEPVGRNTAACCAWAALEVARRDPDAVLLVLPADHVIEPAESFRASCALAARVARDTGALVTLGIRPTHPATGYGYLELGEAHDGLFAVRRFVEKPDAARASEFLASGRFLWNAGIFVWSAAAIRAAFAEHAPEILGPLESGDPAEVYPTLPSVPVDVAILEKAENVLVLPIDYSWNDVGSWTALPEVLEADADGCVVGGDARLVGVDARDCIVYGEGDETIALIGVEDLVVVRSGNATLVCPRDRAQDVRAIVERLEREQPDRL